MKKIQIKDVWLFVAQVLLLSLVLLSPGLISYVTTHDPQTVWDSLTVSAYWLAPAVVVYLVNFYLFVPLLWFRYRRWLLSFSVFVSSPRSIVKFLGSSVKRLICS